MELGKTGKVLEFDFYKNILDKTQGGQKTWNNLEFDNLS